MARVTPAGRPVRRRFGLLILCCALLLAAAACGDDDSVFTTDGNGGTQVSVPGGLGGDDGQNGEGNGTTGTGSNPGGSAAAIPGSAQAYLAIDLGAFADFQALAQAFESLDAGALTGDLGEAAGGFVGEVPGSGEAIEGVEEAQNVMTCLSESLGIQTGGLPAWMGDEAAAALFDMQFDAATGEMSDPNALVTVAVDDQAAAAAALPGFVGSVGTCGGVTFTESAYQGVTVYTGIPADGGAPVSLALTEGYLVYGEGAGMVEQAIALADGATLADDANFNEVLAALPDGRHVSGYLAASLIQEAWGGLAGSMAGSDGLGLPLPTGLDPTQALAGARGLGLAATILPEGIRVDLVAVGDSAERPLSDAGASDLPGLLPADTIGFAGIGAFDIEAAWGSVLEVLAQMPVEEGQPSVQDTITLLGTMLGVDIEADLIAQLTGEAGVGLLPATTGSLAASGVNLGFIAVLGVEDAGAMTPTVAALAEGIARLSQTPASPRPYEGGTLYALSDGTSEIALFGMAGDNLVITSHESHAAALLAGGDKLAGSSRYGEAVGGLPSGSQPFMYLDIAGLVAALAVPAEEAAGLAPLQTLAAGVSSGGGAMGTLTIYARIDY